MEEFSYFNQEDISNIVYKGFVGENEERVVSALKEWRETNINILRGTVSDSK